MCQGQWLIYPLLFDSHMGVKQGESLSPLLFMFFINDLSEHLEDETADIVTINELQLFSLLFADDTVVLF